MDEVEKLIEQLNKGGHEAKKEALLGLEGYVETGGGVRDLAGLVSALFCTFIFEEKIPESDMSPKYKMIKHVKAATVKMKAFNILVKIGKPAVPHIIDRLKHGIIGIRIAAAQVLGEIGNEQAISALIESLEDGHGVVEKSAAESLGKLKLNDEQFMKIVSLLNKEKSPATRLWSAHALGAIGDPRGADPLVMLFIEYFNLVSPSWSPMSAVIQTSLSRPYNIIGGALISIGNASIPALVEAFFDGKDVLKSYANEVSIKILLKCETKEQVKDFEAKLYEGMARLKRKSRNDPIPMEIAKLKQGVTRRKNQLSKDKGILLDAKPKPPKKGMFQQARRVRNG
jgi:hypothetical protein